MIKCLLFPLLFGTVTCFSSSSSPSFPDRTDTNTIVTTTTTTTTTTNKPRPDATTVRQIQQAQDSKLRQSHDQVAFNRLFCGVRERPNPIPLGDADHALPLDFPPGALLRLGPNMEGDTSAEGFLDGDGMVTCVTFPPPSSPSSSSTASWTYVDTRGRQLERERGKVFRGTLGAVPQSWPMLGSLATNMVTFGTLQCQKDTCNTALAVSGNRILALMEQCPPSELTIYKDGRVATIQNNCLVDNGITPAPITGGALSAHGRTTNGERIHVSYSSSTPPYVRVDIFEEGWKLKRSIPIDVPCPTMLHDCAVTDEFVVIFDFPLTLRTSRMVRNEFPVQYEPSYGARIGLQPRAATKDESIWFKVQPGVVLHAANAFERSTDGGTKEVVVHVLRSEPDPKKSYLEEYASSFLYEYVLDPTTGKVIREECLNAEEVLEFPTINENKCGQPADYVYCNSVGSIGGPLEVYKMPRIGLLLNGITKLSLRDDDATTKGSVLGKYTLPDRFFGVSEPTVVPKTSDQGGEYIVLVATYIPEGEHSWKDIPNERLFSRVIILDGDTMEEVWSRDLPHHVNYGLHSEYVPWEMLK